MQILLNGKDASHLWRVHTVKMLKEILNSNPSMSIMAQPLQIFATILYEVAERARELNDDKLNALMCRLTLYEQGDRESQNYDPEIYNEVMKRAYGDISTEEIG